MRPRSEGAIGGLLEITEGVDGFVARLETSLQLARGPGYPSTFTATLENVWSMCGTPAEMEIRLTDVSNDGDAASISLAGNVLQVEVHRAGSTAVTATGTVSLTNDGCLLQDPLPFELSLGVHIFDAQDARIVPPILRDGSRCPTVPPAMAPSSRSTNGVGWFVARLVDPEGEDYVAANAEDNAQVAMSLHGSFEAGHASPTDLSSWIAPSLPGQVQIVPAFGEPLLVEVVEPSAIVGATVEFQVGGTKVGQAPLMDGGTYPDERWGGAVNLVAPMIQGLETRNGPLCTGASEAWFVLETETPSICALEPVSRSEEGHVTGAVFVGDPTGAGVRLERDGLCSLRLHAPDFTAQAGFPLTWNATFLDVDELSDHFGRDP
jgi:hypothetical protein